LASFILAFVFILSGVLFSNEALAINLGGLDKTASVAGMGSGIQSPLGLAGDVTGKIISYVGVLFLCLMLYAGFLWMTAAGDEKKIDKAKEIILAAIIGLVIVLSAYAITRFVGESLSLRNP